MHLRTSARGALLAALLTGTLLAEIDVLLSLGSSPDPESAAYRAGYVLGPVLVALAWTAPLGIAAALVAPRVGPRAAGGVAAVVAVLWTSSVLLDAARDGQSLAALVVLLVVAGTVAGALARLAIDLATALAGLSVRPGRLLGAAAAALLVAATAAVAPAGRAAFRGGTGPCPASGASRSGPNVLLITVDALRADRAAAMRSYRRLARRGVEYREHVSQSPWTLPAIASLLTGLSPNEHGAGASVPPGSPIAKAALQAADTTLAARLGAEGYRTHAIVTNPFLTSRYGIDGGFCTFENVTMEGEAARGLAHTVPLRLVRVFLPSILPSDRANVVTARAERWLTTEPRPAPFFLWLHYLDPHAPYGDRDGASTSLTLDLKAFGGPQRVGEHSFHALGLLRAGEYRPDRDERRRIAALYDEDVAFADRSIEDLLDFLDAHDLSSRTLIVFTADHGEEFWEHGGVEHGRTLYEEVLHVPLVIVPPGGLSHPRSRRDLTTATDVTRLILRASADPVAGDDASDIPRGDDDRVIPLGNLLFGEEWSGVRTATMKYLRSESGEERLFDLVADSEERVNQVGGMPERLATARNALDRAFARTPPGTREQSLAAGPAREARLAR